MAPSPEENSKEAEAQSNSLMDDDDVTVVTETPTSKTDFIEAEMTDQLLRYEIPFTNGHPTEDAFKLHVQLLIAITKAYDKSIVRIYDNTNTRVKSINEKQWLDKKYFENHFTLHVEESQRKTIIVHRIMSKKSVSTIKNDASVMKHLKSSKTFLRGHFWKENEVKLKDIGFLVSYVATKHSKTFITQDMFKRCEPLSNLEWKHAPPFQLIQAQPRIKLSGKQKPLKTFAFSVQVLAKDAAKMNHFLRKLYEDEHLYIPYSMKQKFPQAVAKALLKQNKLINDTWVIVVVGITREIMKLLEPKILEFPGITAISDTQRTDKTGRWNVIVREGAFKSAHKRFTSQIPLWFRDLPSDLIESIPNGFLTPKVHQKNGYEDDDDSSSGQDSYMSSCAQSYGSFDDNITDAEFYDPPSQNRSYAAALTGSTLQSPAVTEIIVPVRGSPREQETKEYHSVIAGLQADVTIANLQAQVKSLQHQLLGAQTPSTVTESSAPESSGASDRMAKLESNMAIMTSQFTEWMLEM